MNERQVKVSKFLSKHLRHSPEALGLTLEPGGWVLIEDLLRGAAERKFRISREELNEVVADNDKQRYSFDESGTKIRANQGHSVEVDLQLQSAVPPAELFHGTVEKFLDAILWDGLQKMNRHDVHLSPNLETAIKVGQRRGKPVILIVDSGRMHADGFQFRMSDNGVWLTEHVPPQYLRRADG